MSSPEFAQEARRFDVSDERIAELLGSEQANLGWGRVSIQLNTQALASGQSLPQRQDLSRRVQAVYHRLVDARLASDDAENYATDLDVRRR